MARKKKSKKNKIFEVRDENQEAELRARLRGYDKYGNKLPIKNLSTGQDNTYLCSESLVDQHFFQKDKLDNDGNSVSVRMYEKYPANSPMNPDGGASKMVRCPVCGSLVPKSYTEDGRCADHQPERLHDAYGSSPSARAIQALRARNLRVVDNVKMLPESKAVLRREIKRYKSGQWKPSWLKEKKSKPPAPPADGGGTQPTGN